MYVTAPVALAGQRKKFDAAVAWPRASTLDALTMDETTRVAPSNTIHRFFTYAPPPFVGSVAAPHVLSLNLKPPSAR
jgi:hypothetical protein